MPYATQDQLTDRFGEKMVRQLTDRATPPAGAIDADVVARALADTDAVIDGYLAGRYALPLVATPDLVVDLALAIAIYKLHLSTAPDLIVNNYKDAIATLNRIGTGVVRLPVAGVEPESSGASGVETTDRERPFTELNLKGFI